MTELRRRFAAASPEGHRFVVLEYATFRWERNALGERCRIENDYRELVTDDGFRVSPTDDPAAFRINELGLTLLILRDADGEYSPLGRGADTRAPMKSSATLIK